MKKKIAWLRKLLAWQDDITDSGEVMSELRSQAFDDCVYVFTPKGEVVDLPTGSTPLDLLMPFIVKLVIAASGQSGWTYCTIYLSAAIGRSN